MYRSENIRNKVYKRRNTHKCCQRVWPERRIFDKKKRKRFE